MRISTVGPLPPAPHDYMPHAKAFGNYKVSYVHSSYFSVVYSVINNLVLS